MIERGLDDPAIITIAPFIGSDNNSNVETPIQGKQGRLISHRISTAIFPLYIGVSTLKFYGPLNDPLDLFISPYSLPLSENSNMETPI